MTFIQWLLLQLAGCERCQSIWNVQMESSRTQYHDESLNRDVRLCRPCAREHHDHWDAMWSEYYSGLI